MIQTQFPQEIVHPDTQAVLLLCGSFASASEPDTKPLTPQEYNALALWLVRQGRRPGELLGSAAELLPADETGLPRAERVRALLGRGVLMAAVLERWQRLGLWVIGRGEDGYPERLRRNLRSAAPPLLFGAGDVSRLAQGGLAVVGSRHVDEQGLSFTHRVGERCAAAGIQVISGGARGVDQAAVFSCLEAGGGGVAVLADRLDRLATSRQAKESIRNGQLTLVSPYEPEAGFTVGRAMGRNKHIYALADYGLVVRFTAGEGGTWAGAIEQLRRNQPDGASVPVFIRVAENPTAGWDELRRRGALPFPEEEFWEGDVAEVLSRAAGGSPNLSPPIAAAESPATESNGDATRSPELSAPAEAAPPKLAEVAPVPSPPAEEAETCYSLGLPLLLRSLRHEPGKKELPQVAKQLEILPQQLKTWLDRAMKDGKVKEVKRKRGRKVYVDASREGQANLYGHGDDAA